MHGLPGFFDDSKVWVALVKTMELTSYLWIIAVPLGLLIATWEWWRKYLPNVVGFFFPMRKMRKEIERLDFEISLQSAKNLLLQIELWENKNTHDEHMSKLIEILRERFGLDEDSSS